MFPSVEGWFWWSKKVESGGVETGVKIKINLMFLISKFMSNYHYKYNEVLDLNWFTFNDLLEGLRGVRIEQETQKLNLFINELVVEKSKDGKEAFEKLMENKKDQFKSYTEYDTSERDLKEFNDFIKGRGGKI